jgi:hypothetical protein
MSNFLSRISNILVMKGRSLVSIRIEDDRRTTFSLNDPEAYEAICKRRARADRNPRGRAGEG